LYEETTLAATLEKPMPLPPEQAESQASRRLACLVEVARVVNSSLELDVVLDQVITQARAILSAESGSIMLVDDSTCELQVLAAQGPRAATVRGRRQALGDGVAGWVARHGEPLLLHGPARDSRFGRASNRKDVRDALCAPLKVDGEVLGVISLNNRRCEDPFSNDDLDLLMALAHQAALAIRNARSFQELRHQRRTVERLLDEVTRAHEEERLRVSLLLHDGAAQTLFASLKMAAAIRAQLPPSSSAIIGVVDELEASIRSSIAEIRALMVDLRPPCLDELGLAAALRQHARVFEQRTGIPTEVSHLGSERRMPWAVEVSFYRIAQEALTNVWKHAAARKARVVLEIGEKRCSLEVSDDGRGFDPQTPPAQPGQHLGMVSLRERADLAGGRLKVVSSPGKGTRICVSAPVVGANERGRTA
jgi:two-component system NarL family sensor kinase